MAEHFKIGTHSLDPQTGPSRFIAAVVKRLVPASLTLEKQRKHVQRVLAGTPPPSKESRNIVFLCFLCFFCFSKVFNKCGVLQGSYHESQAKLSKCLWEHKNISKTFHHLKSWENCTPRGCRSVT